MRRALRDAVMAGRADEGLSNAGPAARIESALRLLGAATPADEATTAAENVAASPQGGRAASAAAARSALPPPPPALGAPHRVTSVTVETHEGSWSSPCWAAPAPAPVSAGASPVACRSPAASPSLSAAGGGGSPMPPRPPAGSPLAFCSAAVDALCNGSSPSSDRSAGGAASFPAAREAFLSAAVASPHAVVCESLRRMQTRLRRGEVPARDAARRVRVISELLRALPAATYTDSLAQLRREAAAAGDGGEAESGGEGPVNCDAAQASLADALDMYLLAHRAEAESRLHPSQRRRPASASHAGGGGGGGGGGDGSLRGVSDASVDAALAEVMSTYLGRALLPLGAAPAHPHLAPSAVRYVGRAVDRRRRRQRRVRKRRPAAARRVGVRSGAPRGERRRAASACSRRRRRRRGRRPCSAARRGRTARRRRRRRSSRRRSSLRAPSSRPRGRVRPPSSRSPRHSARSARRRRRG